MLARDQLVTAVLRYLSCERAEPHSSHEAELEYASDMVDEAARQLSACLSATPKFRERWKDTVAKARGGDAPPPSAQGFA